MREASSGDQGAAGCSAPFSLSMHGQNRNDCLPRTWSKAKFKDLIVWWSQSIVSFSSWKLLENLFWKRVGRRDQRLVGKRSMRSSVPLFPERTTWFSKILFPLKFSETFISKTYSWDLYTCIHQDFFTTFSFYSCKIIYYWWKPLFLSLCCSIRFWNLAALWLKSRPHPS